ncbi:hypothetical protein [Sulfurimonas sp. HSL3-7]|uniref:hypothetical protein n=1 Tax=Sulfonitrofixus jiaomeiensis TaxID=3131938 RepID=UPI0031FA1591
MKLVKMSLLAATLVASSAFAIDNVKVSGDAKLYYATNDGDNMVADAALFNKDSSAGQAALGLGLTADLTDGVSAGVHMTALSAMGLTNIVSNVWEGALTDEYWFDEAWLAGTYGKTTAKVGRMTLDTPLAFTETWSIAKNTFEAGVLLNQDIPDTTLVGAYIGESNAGGAGLYGNVIANFDGNQNTNFGLVNGGKGAYAVGAVNNSWTPLTVQGWYYNLPSFATAYWVQGDLAFDMGLSVGAQVAGIDVNAIPTGDTSNTAFAGKVGYEMKDTFAVSVAGSQTGENDNGVGAGFNVFGVQSKLYTEAWWNYGYITRADTTAINVTATTPEALTWVALGLYATQTTTTDGVAAGTDLEMTDITVTASKSVGPLDVTLAVISTEADDQNAGDAYLTAQAYLTYNF